MKLREPPVWLAPLLPEVFEVTEFEATRAGSIIA
jgi:hypothetical protein